MKVAPGTRIAEAMNWLCYVYRREAWAFDCSRLFRSYDDVEIDRPIFLLGTQGGGLTLVSRMLRRNPTVISVTGNHTYWAGADEMQNVLGPILPPQLTGIKNKIPPHPDFPPPRGWLYAIDALLPLYRLTEKDADADLKSRFLRLLRWLIAHHQVPGVGTRFTDKSQLYTIKVAFLNKLLEGTDPRFLLITRNPYALCYRSANGGARSCRRLAERFSLDERVRLAAEHWDNSMRCALEDGEKVNSFHVLRFESLLERPEQQLKETCRFLDLEFDRRMIPNETDVVPLGSRFRNRWYPLRPSVNDRYLREIGGEHVRIIAARCGELARRLGYAPPEQVPDG